MLVLAVGTLVSLPVEAARMVCKITISSIDNSIVGTDCQAQGDPIEVTYHYVDVIYSATTSTSSGGGHSGHSSGASSNQEGPAKLAVRKNLKDKTVRDALRKAIKKVKNRDDITDDDLKKACDLAADSVASAVVVRDGKVPPPGGEAGRASPKSIPQTGRLQITIDGDYTDQEAKRWVELHGREPESDAARPGSLGNVLMHEGIHACLHMVNITDHHHAIMADEIAYPCADDPHLEPYIPKCDLEDEKDTVPSKKLSTDSLLRTSRRLLLNRIKDRSFVRDPSSGAIGVVYGSHAFPLPAGSSAGVGVNPQNLWADALVDFKPPSDGLLVKESGGPTVVFFGGSPIEVPNDDALNSIRWWVGNGAPIELWKGATRNLPRAPRDGTLLQEIRADHSVHNFVIYGGSRFEIPDIQTFDRMGYPQTTILRIWSGGTDRFLGPPRDGTLLRDPTGAIFVMMDGRRVHVPSMAVFAKHYRSQDVRILWSGALQRIPERAWGPNVTAKLDGIQRATLVAGDGRPTAVRYHIENTGTEDACGIYNIDVLQRTEGINSSGERILSLPLKGALTPGQRMDGSFTIDGGQNVGRNSLQLSLQWDATACDTDRTDNLSNTLAFDLVRNTSVTPPGGDLIVRVDALANNKLVLGGEPTWVTYRVTNIGTAPIISRHGRVVARYFMDGKDCMCGSYVTTPIAPGASVSASFAIDLPAVPLGKHSFVVKVIPWDEYPETNVTNNVSNETAFEVVNP